MRTPLLALAAVLLAAVLLAACSTGAPTSTASRTTAPPSTTAQGFQPLRLGEKAGLGCDGGSCTVQFAVTSIDINPACARFGTQPPAGQKTVVLHVTITTTTPERQHRAQAGLLFSNLQLKGVGPDGAISGVDYGSCLDQPGAIDRNIAPNAIHEGFLEISVDQAATSIATTPASSDLPGWVWPLG